MKLNIDKMNEGLKNSSAGKILTYISKFPNQKISHYSTSKALYDGIIVGDAKKGKEICLRATNCQYLNDPKELMIGAEVFEKIFNFNLQGDSNSNEAKNISAIKDNVFIISFSAKKDYLPMWSMYGAHGDGIMLVFDSRIIRKCLKEDQLIKCVYSDTASIKRLKQESTYPEILKEDIDDINKASEKFLNIIGMGILDTVGAIMSFIYLFVAGKHKSYSYESEIRLMVTADNEHPVEYKHSNNLIIPFVEVFLPKEALKEIWIGPSQDMCRAEKSIQDFLATKKFKHVKILRSEAPYRK